MTAHSRLSATLAAVLYLVSGVLFILTLRGLSSPESSRTGNRPAAARSLASELTTALSEVPGYRVASPLAAGGPRPLDVAYVLDGTVQRERTRIRVNLRFVDAKRDSTMWAIARVGSLDSLFALQDTLRAAATAALRGALR